MNRIDTIPQTREMELPKTSSQILKTMQKVADQIEATSDVKKIRKLMPELIALSREQSKVLAHDLVGDCK